jgi:hypothetical protein
MELQLTRQYILENCPSAISSQMIDNFEYPSTMTGILPNSMLVIPLQMKLKQHYQQYGYEGFLFVFSNGRKFSRIEEVTSNTGASTVNIFLITGVDEEGEYIYDSWPFFIIAKLNIVIPLLENHDLFNNLEIAPIDTNYLIAEETSRFSSAIWFDKIKSKNVILAGLGGIGSYIAFLLARVDINSLTLFDNDRVETVNLSGQLYKIQDLNQLKTTATIDNITSFANYRKAIAKGLYTNESSASDIMICGFDNMAARTLFFNNWKRHLELETTNKESCLYIDGRLSADELQIFCIQGSDNRAIKEYQNNALFLDSEGEATICSFKQTTFMANLIGSFIVNLFINFVANECDPLITKDIPYYTEYKADTMYLKTIS